VHNFIILPRRAAVPGHGWAASSVTSRPRRPCRAAGRMLRESAGRAEPLKIACRGYPAIDGCIPIAVDRLTRSLAEPNCQAGQFDLDPNRPPRGARCSRIISALYTRGRDRSGWRRGVCSAQLGGTYYPLVGADVEQIKSLRPYAETIRGMLRVPVRPVRFSTRETPPSGGFDVLRSRR
jgi:hypothetical protein